VRGLRPRKNYHLTEAEQAVGRIGSLERRRMLAHSAVDGFEAGRSR
jgi:hypothetical protein